MWRLFISESEMKQGDLEGSERIPKAQKARAPKREALSIRFLEELASPRDRALDYERSSGSKTLYGILASGSAIGSHARSNHRRRSPPFRDEKQSLVCLQSFHVVSIP
jgi:hypothetical protein